MGPACQYMNKRLAQKIEDKREEKYCHVINHVRTHPRFALLKGVLIALTGERGRPTKNKDTASDMCDIDFGMIPEIRSYESQ